MERRKDKRWVEKFLHEVLYDVLFESACDSKKEVGTYRTSNTQAVEKNVSAARPWGALYLRPVLYCEKVKGKTQ